MKKIDKPWGYEIIWADTDKYVGKILHVEAGHSLSRQYHIVKEETLMVLSGVMEIELGSGSAIVKKQMTAGDVQHISPGVIHRIIGVTTLEVMEVSTSQLTDVVRLEDNYGRSS